MRTRCVATAAILVCAAGAAAQTATFDSQAEGFVGFSYVENGLTFHDLDQRIPGSPPPGSLNIEDASQDLAGQPGFTSPNCLGFGGYSPGPGGSFGRIGSLTITPATPGTSASLEIYDFNFDSGHTISLAAFLNGQEVARTTVPLLTGGMHHTHLTVAAPQFDSIKLISEGPSNEGTFFAIIDGVTIQGGPAPCYANCDGSTGSPALNVNDFVCFQTRFAAAESYADCDHSGGLNVNDFVCFQTAFAAGCR